MLRRAKINDAKEIQRLVNFYAKKNEMLPLSLSELYDHIRSFFVYERNNRIVGCGSLRIIWEDLGEIRSLAVYKKAMGKGIGKSIVEECLKEARALGLRRVFVLTYKASFFKKFSFKGIDKYKLPHKVWRDCIKCVHFPNCHEDALIKRL
ncbi:MAG: N-acetyltransferase [Candidatus Omnitrophica bacterium]|nr:N-acetyltransferase [Candidatus Omnitrophota bacterium]